MTNRRSYVKFFSLISSAAIFSALTITGFCDSQIIDLESRVLDLESAQSFSAEDLLSHQDKGYYSSKPSSGSSTNENRGPKIVLDSDRGCQQGVGVTFDLEFLWLRAVEDGIGYAWKFNDIQTDRFIKPLDQNFQFKPGFRVGLGYNSSYDDWDFNLRYMWHYTYVKTAVQGEYRDGRGSIAGTLTFLPVNDGSLLLVFYERGKSRWQNQLNAWDLDLGRSFYVGKNFALKPVLGLKGALIRQHLQAFLYHSEMDRIIDGRNYVEWNDISARFKSRFWGVGPKVGMDGKWNLGSGFSLYGGVDVAALYGQFQISGDIIALSTLDRVNDPSRVGENVGGHINDSFYRLRMMADTKIGIQWSRCFWDWMNFCIHLGWEAQYWWQQMEFLNFKDISPDGDLSLTGIDAGLRFEF